MNGTNVYWPDLALSRQTPKVGMASLDGTAEPLSIEIGP
jgi:hypothetical protein